MVGLSQVFELSIFSLNLATMLGLGLGIDYSLFIVSRFREELPRRRGDVAEAGSSHALAGVPTNPPSNGRSSPCRMRTCKGSRPRSTRSPRSATT
jgi:hypothetical protein